MKTENTKEFSEVFDGFAGIDLTSPIGSSRLSDLRNFRLLSDGSVIKRSGYRLLNLFDGEIRGATAYADGGEDVILAVSGRNIYRITAEGVVSCGEALETSEGEIDFFELRGNLYIIDGAKIYRYTGGVSAAVCSPYAPLYGKDWAANYLLPERVNEPINLLTPRIRISYRCTGSQVSVLTVGLPIKSIDAVYLDGKLQNNSLFGVHKDGDKVSCTSFYVNSGSEAILYVTVDGSECFDAAFAGCNRAEVFDSFSASRLFVYGGENGSGFFVSPAIDDATLAAENEVYGYVDPIYVPKGGATRLGGMNFIRGMCRVCDRMLIFSDSRTWITSSLNNEEGKSRFGVSLELVSDTLGCSSPKAVRIIGGAKPVTVSRSGIFKWSFDSEFEEEAVTSRISDKVTSRMTADFLRNATVCYDSDSGELWFGNSLSEDGEVLIYDCGRGLWWLYDNVGVDKFIETPMGVAFVKGKAIYLFDSELIADIDLDGEREIVGVIESAGFDLSLRNKTKHICGVSLLGELDGGRTEITVEDGRILAELNLDAADASPIHACAELIDTRVNTSRTERARFSLRAPGRSRQRIYGLEFRAYC